MPGTKRKTTPKTKKPKEGPVHEPTQSTFDASLEIISVQEQNRAKLKPMPGETTQSTMYYYKITTKDGDGAQKEHVVWHSELTKAQAKQVKSLSEARERESKNELQVISEEQVKNDEDVIEEVGNLILQACARVQPHLLTSSIRTPSSGSSPSSQGSSETAIVVPVPLLTNKEMQASRVDSDEEKESYIQTMKIRAQNRVSGSSLTTPSTWERSSTILEPQKLNQDLELKNPTPVNESTGNNPNNIILHSVELNALYVDVVKNKSVLDAISNEQLPEHNTAIMNQGKIIGYSIQQIEEPKALDGLTIS